MIEEPTPYLDDDEEDDNPLMRAYHDTLTTRERLAALSIGIVPNPDHVTAPPAPAAFDNDPWGNNLKRRPWLMR